MADQPPRRLADVDVSAPPRPSTSPADTDLAAPALDDDARMDDVRAEVRRLLIDAVNDVARAEFGGNLYATAAIEELTNAYVRLGGDLELPARTEALDAYRELAERYTALVNAAGAVCDAAAELAVDDFTPRTERLVAPLNRLAEQVGR